ncbi:MAG: hypothetical protein P8104_05455 [Gammaproteobacteria bacterium]
MEQGLLRLRVHNPDQEEAFEELEVDYSGEATEIGFNFSYLLDVLQVLSEEDIRFTVSGGDHPSTVIQADDDDSARFVVMPMRY